MSYPTKNIELNAKDELISELKAQILQRLDALEARVQEIGLEIGVITKIILEHSAPAEQMSEEQFAADLHRLLAEIFQGAHELPFDVALRRAAALEASEELKHIFSQLSNRHLLAHN